LHDRRPPQDWAENLLSGSALGSGFPFSAIFLITESHRHIFSFVHPSGAMGNYFAVAVTKDNVESTNGFSLPFSA
jgi:acetylornithine/succinyldiaminopimelate/putrescine aminotransferase